MRRWFLLLSVLVLLVVSIRGSSGEDSNLIALAVSKSYSPYPTIVSDYGMIFFQYNKQIDRRIYISVAKDDQVNFLVITNKDISLPLSFGNGTYQVKFLRNIVGNNYAIEKTFNVLLNQVDENRIFTEESSVVKFDLCDNTLKYFNNYTSHMSHEQKVLWLYDFIGKKHRYSIDASLKDVAFGEYVVNTDKLFTERKGMCFDYSISIARLLRQVGIPTKVITGSSELAEGYHSWNEVYLNGQWRVIDFTQSFVRTMEDIYCSEGNISNVKFIY